MDEILSQVARDPKYRSERRVSIKGLPIAGKHPTTSFSSGGSRARKEKSSLPSEDKGKSLPSEPKVPIIKIKPVPPPKQPEEGPFSTQPSLEPLSAVGPQAQLALKESLKEHQLPLTHTSQELPAGTQMHSQAVVSSHSQFVPSSISQVQLGLEPTLPPVQEHGAMDRASPAQEQPRLAAEKALEDVGASGGEEHASPLAATVNASDAEDKGIHDNEPDQRGEDVLTEIHSHDPETTESMSAKDAEAATSAVKDDIESDAGEGNDDVDVESLDVPFSEAKDSPDASASLQDLSVSDTTDSSAAPSPLPPHSSMQPSTVHDINEESRLSFTDNQSSMHHVLDVDDGHSPIPRKLMAEKVLLHLSSSSTSSSVSSFSDLPSLPELPLPAEPEVPVTEEDKGDQEAHATAGDGGSDTDAPAARPVAATPPGLIVQSLGTVTTSPLIVSIKKKYYQKGGGKKKKGQKKRKRDSSPKKTAPAPKRTKLLTEDTGVSFPSSEAGPASASSVPPTDNKAVTPVTSVPGLLITRTAVTTTNASSLFQERDLPKSTPPRRKDSAKQGLTVTTTVSGVKMKAGAGRDSSDKGSKLAPSLSRKKGKKDKSPRSIKKNIKSASASRLTVSTSAVKQVSPLVISSLSHSGLTVSSKPDQQVTAGRSKPASRGRGKPGPSRKLTVTSNEPKTTVLFPRSPAKNVRGRDSSSSGSDSNDDDQSDSSSSISMATPASVGRSSSGL